MRRTVVLLTAIAALIGGSLVPAAAQDGSTETSLSDTIIRTLGYPRFAIEVGPDGVVAPAIVTEGYYLVVFSAAESYVGYVDIMQPPAELSEEEVTELALAAASEDLAQEGWGYAGGSNTFEIGVPARFVVYLAAGEYQIAASYYELATGSEEVMRLTPLTVTVATDGTTIFASDVAVPPVSDGTLIVAPAATEPPATDEPTIVALDAAEPPATVILEETDELRYVVTPDPVPTGPQLWEIANTGEVHAHHVVMARVPDGTVAEDIIGEFADLMAGTPPAPDSVFAQFVFVGYAALQSGGQTTWVEYDLQPGTYAAVCFIVDPQTERPHALDGMVTIFTVA